MSTRTALRGAGPATATAALDGYLARRAGKAGGAQRPPLTYLRCKPGRGLVAVFGSAARARQVYTVTVDEDGAGVTGDPTVQEFPHDPHLPHLAAAMSPAEHPLVRDALESAARDAAGLGPEWAMVSSDAVALRYKPRERCVVRYHLGFRLAGEAGGGSWEREVTLVGKVYRDAAQAAEAELLLDRLWAVQGETPWTARPLGCVEGLPLLLTEDLGGAGSDPATLQGTDVLRMGTAPGAAALRHAAYALADLHTSGVLPTTPDPRTGSDEAAKASKRARTLARYVPSLAVRTSHVAAALCDALTRLPADVLRPVHGSYKPSQLLVRGDQVLLVDFDQTCWADPALDVGYFLAYLRPPGLWYRRAGTRAWFQEAAAAFTAAYEERLLERGEDAAVAAAIVRRSHVYEAALLLKIAARRPNRLHSPRAGEVAAVLAEVEASLAAAAPGGAVRTA